MPRVYEELNVISRHSREKSMTLFWAVVLLEIDTYVGCLFLNLLKPCDPSNFTLNTPILLLLVLNLFFALT